MEEFVKRKNIEYRKQNFINIILCFNIREKKEDGGGRAEMARVVPRCRDALLVVPTTGGVM